MNPGPRTHEGASLMVSDAPKMGLSDDLRAQCRQIVKVYTKPERRGKGDARWLMAEVCKEADDANLVLMLTVKPYGDDAPMESAALERFYRQFDFITLGKNEEGDTMLVRKCKAQREHEARKYRIAQTRH